MTPTQELRAWQRAHPARKVYWGRKLVAIADGERSVSATGDSTEDAARAVLALWYSPAPCRENQEQAA
jgi:hypothetical protein